MEKYVVYKGIKIPAKTIETGKGTIETGKGEKKLIPISTHRYVLYGPPFPRNLDLTEELRATAKEIITNSKNTSDRDKSLLIRYIRKTANGYVSQNRYFARKGEPHGGVVAFLYNEKLRIGWSKRIEGIEKGTLSHGKIKQKEPLVFTKIDAVYVAVLRGLVDKIVLRQSGTYTNKDKVIPRKIVKTLFPFIKRVQKAFDRAVSNVKLA